jgi:hypothetical protein
VRPGLSPIGRGFGRFFGHFAFSRSLRVMATTNPDRPPSERDLAFVTQLAEALAPLVAAELRRGPETPDGLLSAAHVARLYGVDRGWVYDHARELGALRLGSGARPRLRFDPKQVAEALRGTGPPPAVKPSRASRRPNAPRRRSSSVDLLPVEPGRRVNLSGANRRPDRG